MERRGPHGIAQNAGNAALMRPSRRYRTKMSPSGMKDRMRQYFAMDTERHIEDQLRYADDMFTARVQGIDEADFYKWYETRLRMVDFVQIGTTQNTIEDWKEFLFENPAINEIGLGAKIECGTSTYIVSNPNSHNGMQTGGVARRCNATWRRYDFYGNIIEEPFYWAKNQAQATANEYLDYMVVPNLYQKCVMQMNPDTMDLDTNRRMVLGRSVYMVRGLVDFLQSATGDLESTHIYYFDLMYQESTSNDDMEKRIADGKGFSFTLKIEDLPETTVSGQSIQASVEATRNGRKLTIEDGVTYGEAEDGSRENYGNKPLTYRWESSDESVATVAEDGVVTTIGEGTVSIFVTVEENPELRGEWTLTVSDHVESTLEWVQTAETVSQYNTVNIECAYFENGVETDEPVAYTVKASNRNAASWTTDGNVLTITGYLPNETVTVTAAHGTMTSEKTLKIIGY